MEAERRQGALDAVAAWLDRAARLWTALPATLAYAWFLARVMPAQSARSRSYAGDWGGPDRHYFYTPDELYAQVATWGAAGREQYMDFRLGPDIGFALAYGAFLVTWTGLALRRAWPGSRGARRWLLLPLLPVAFDLLENALGIALVQGFPARHEELAWLAAAITLLKWSSLALAHVLLLVAMVQAVRARPGR
jgi:hypothetical protein